VLESGQIPRVSDDDELSITDQTAVVAPNSVRSKARPMLMVMVGKSAGQVFRLTKSRTTIGRSKQAEIVLDDEGISRVHCAFTNDAGGWSVEDVGSTNGTIVNGERVSSISLQAGDRVQVGASAVVQFGFYDDTEEGLVSKLYEAATRDPLTGVSNRRNLFERLEAEVSFATRHGEKLVAVMFDIDHFKSINDSYGHAVGDSVLRDVAQCIGATLRNEDVFARYGGEEFALLARGLSVKNGVKLAERIRELVSDRVLALGGNRFRVTVSAGVAELGECKPARTGAALLDLADRRLFLAKERGRNRIVGK
jgi:diguanylate cyclase (GGDEF)-like protein